jgi:SAM-dependent methyltransferase
LHQFISEVAQGCLGVDLDGRTISELRERNTFTNVVEGDVERLADLSPEHQGFDLVVAGDIIEHLSNPGLMLDGLKARLGPGGRLIVSTPNAFGIAAWLRVLCGRFREGAQHVLCFNPITLEQLLVRHGFVVREAYTCHQLRARQGYGFLFGVLAGSLRRFPRYGGTLLYICEVYSDEPNGHADRKK